MTTPTITRSDQFRFDSQRSPVAAGTTSGEGQGRPETHSLDALAGTPDHRLDQSHHHAHMSNVESAPTLPQATCSTAPMVATPAGSTSSTGQFKSETQTAPARAGASPDDGSGATIAAATPRSDSSLFDPFLALAADILDDAEESRIANENRLRQLTRAAADSDGEERGFGLDESHPDVARVAALVEMLKQIEHNATLNLTRLLRQHPLGPWVKAQKGIGDKQGARLLAVIGDPYINMATGEIRTVSQLWAYCGNGDPTRHRFKGMTQADLFGLGSPVAKSRLWLIACSCLKTQGPYAGVYYVRKAANEGREHAVDCKRCGPSGKPALAGSPWSDAHRHADALRITGKEILRDLWLEAKRIHETEKSA